MARKDVLILLALDISNKEKIDKMMLDKLCASNSMSDR
jgi:hypothetical protein